MTDDPKPYTIIAEGLRLALSTDKVLSDVPLDLPRALQIRNDLYDLLTSLHALPESAATKGLGSLVATAFRTLQARLTASSPEP